MNEFGLVTGAVEHTHGADGRTLDDGEAQAGARRKRPVDADSNDTAGAVVGFVQGETRIRIECADVAAALFADETPLAVAGLPGVELSAVPLRWPRCSVGPGDNGADGCVFKDRVCGQCCPPWGEAGNQTAAGRTRRRKSDRKKKRGVGTTRQRRGSPPRIRRLRLRRPPGPRRQCPRRPSHRRPQPRRRRFWRAIP